MNFKETLRMFGGNPKNMILNMLKNSNDPTMNKLIQMVENGNSKGVEEYARKFCGERGISFDEEFSKFMSSFK